MKTLELFDIGSPEPSVTEVDGNVRLLDVVEIDEKDVLVRVAEADDHAEPPELDITTTIADLAQGNSVLSLMRGPRARVTVVVSYVGDSVPVEVHVATRLRRVRKLAIEALGLDADLAADTVLRREGSDEDLSLKRPVGAYMERGQRDLALDLVHKVRAQG